MSANFTRTGTGDSPIDTICAICREPMQPPQAILSHEAAARTNVEGRAHEAAEKVFHEFHQGCLESWFREGRGNCPTCMAIWPGRQEVIRPEEQEVVNRNERENEETLIDKIMDIIASAGIFSGIMVYIFSLQLSDF